MFIQVCIESWKTICQEETIGNDNYLNQDRLTDVKDTKNYKYLPVMMMGNGLCEVAKNSETVESRRLEKKI